MRVLTVGFWVFALIYAGWLALNGWSSAVVTKALGETGSGFINAALLVVMAVCSGLILWNEWRNNPVEESARGEWTNTQLFYAIVFTITFFVGFLSSASWFFSL